MALLKIFVISSLLLFETIDADECNEKKITFSVESIWKSYNNNKGDVCDADEELKKDVQEYYDGCRKAAWEFRGPSYDVADNVLNSFEIFLTKLAFYANSNSTLLASSSQAILESIRKCSKLGVSGFNIIKEFSKVDLAIVKDLNEVVKKLSNIIGQLVDSVTDALSALGCAYSNFMSKFIKSEETGFKNEVDYVPVLKQFQKLINTVALIAEILLNKCELVGVNEAVTILSLIVHYFAIATQGINSCYQTVLYEQSSTVPQKIELSSAPLENVLLGVTQMVDSVAFPFTESSKTQLIKLVTIAISLNAALKDIHGTYDGVTIKVGAITLNQLKSNDTSVEGVTKELNDA